MSALGYPPGNLIERYHLPVSHPLAHTYSVVVTDLGGGVYLTSITGPHGQLIRGTGRTRTTEAEARAVALTLLDRVKNAEPRTVDACDKCKPGEVHTGHSEWIAWPGGRQNLWCLGYYDQERQNEIILIDSVGIVE
jgi:hypothetical protein